MGRYVREVGSAGVVLGGGGLGRWVDRLGRWVGGGS